MSDPWTPVSPGSTNWASATNATLATEGLLSIISTEDGLYTLGIEGFQVTDWISANAASLVSEDMLAMISTEDGLNIGVEGYQQTIWTPVN